MEFLTTFLAVELPYLASVATSVIGGAAIIAAVTPTKRDDKILGKVARFFDVVGFNVGNAQNKTLEQEVEKVTKAGQVRRRTKIDAKKKTAKK